jgi:hypothetical protein
LIQNTAERELKAVIYQIEQYDIKAIMNNARGLVKAANGEMSLDNAVLAVIQFDRLTHIYNELARTANLLTPTEQKEKEKFLQKFS